MNCHQKRKTNYASPILTGSGQCALHWRRIARPRSPDRCYRSGASPLTVRSKHSVEAHKTCPYSKALRGDTNVKLVVD